MDLFRKCMDPVEKCLKDSKIDKGSVHGESRSRVACPINHAAGCLVLVLAAVLRPLCSPAGCV
jgi:hypothetical protein